MSKINKKELNIVLKTKKEINQAIKNAITNGNWIVRTDKDGKSYNGFEWEGFAHKIRRNDD